MELPTLRQLEYAVALAETLHFRKAAEATFVSQPGLSAQIQQLERHLGVALFERDRRQVRLTQAGAEVVRRARRILTDARDLVEIGRQFAEPLTGSLRLGVIPTVAPYLLPIALPKVRRRFPELELLLREDLTPHLVAALANGHLDLLLIALEADLGEVTTESIGREAFVVAVPSSHRLAKRKRIALEELEGEDVLLLEDGHCLRDQALSLCHRARAPEIGDFRATSLNTLVRMVASGLGITLLPELAVSTEVRSQDRLTILRLQGLQVGRELAFAWRPSSPRAAEFHDLAKVFREAASSSLRAAK